MRFDLSDSRRVFALVAMVLICAASAACTKEGRAERLYGKAQAEIESGEVDAGVALLEQVLARYPDTDTALLVAEEIETYRGLKEAIDRYPRRSARMTMVRTARAIERYGSRNRSYPAQLADLAPKYFDAEPADPWGRPLRYKALRGGRGYELICLGADGEPGGEGDAADLVVRDGRFADGSGALP